MSTEVANYIAQHRNFRLHTDKKEGEIAMIEMAVIMVVYLLAFVLAIYLALTYCTEIIDKLGYQGTILPLLLALSYHPIEVVASTIDDIANVQGLYRELEKMHLDVVVTRTVVRHLVSVLIIVGILGGLIFGAIFLSQQASQVISPEKQVIIVGVIVLMLVAEKALMKYFLH